MKENINKKSSPGMTHIVRAIFLLLTKKNWRQTIPLLIIMSISSILNAVGIAMVVPFIAVASNPLLIHTNFILFKIFTLLKFNSDYYFLFFLGVIALLLLLIGNILTILVGWLSAKVSLQLYYQWVNKFFSGYLAQPYLFFLNIKTAELSRTLLSSIRQVSSLVLMMFSLLSSCLSIIMMFIMLMMVNPLPAFCIVISVGLIYIVIFFAVKNLIRKTSYHQGHAEQQSFKIVEEVFTMIKEVKLYHKEDQFLDAFELPTRLHAHYNALYQGIMPVPRSLLEVVAFGGVILLVLYLLLSQHDLGAFLPMLGFFVVALYRIMPLTQMIFGQYSSILSAGYCVNNLVDDYYRLNIKNVDSSQFAVNKTEGEFQDLKLEVIYFQYPNTLKPAISDLNLTLTSGKVVAFVGPSGAGKTTAVDIILGLLQPTSGYLRVNGQVLDSAAKIRSWQATLGYVSQSIMLSNNTIAQNIAFGETLERIDMEQVKKVVEFSQLKDFIESLPEQYNTEVGDRGIRLSGGQRQRIGIARALYRNPEILILDEATNALDGLTEMEIMQSVHALAREKTVIIIAHRLQTVMACDRLYYIDQGHLVAEGTYDELARTHPGFKRMVEVAEGNSQHNLI